MKKNLTKLIAMGLSLAMLTVAVSACGGKDSTKKGSSTAEGPKTTAASDVFKPDTSKAVKLKMYVIGTPAKNEAEWIAESNKKLTEKINATIEFSSVAWPEFRAKFPLLLASGEPFDMIYTADWGNYFQEAAKGGYLAINDLIPKYAPTLYKEVPKDAWDAVSVNKKIFMVPVIAKTFTQFGVVIRGDLRKKYNVPEIKNLKDLGVYLEAVKTNMPEMIPFNSYPNANTYHSFLNQMDWSRPMVGGNLSPIVYDINKGGNAFLSTDTPEFEEFIKMSRTWYEKGYWSKSILSNKTADADQMKNGQSAAAIVNTSGATGMYQYAVEKNLPWDVEYYPLENGTKPERATYANNGTAIYKNSPNPERALMFLDLMNSNRDIHDMFFYGDPKKNNIITTDGKVKIADGISPTDAAWGNYGMGVIQGKFTRDSVNKWPKIIELEKTFDQNAISLKYGSFVFDPAAVAGEIAAVTNVLNTYAFGLLFGVLDPAKELSIYKAKLKEAGIDKVLAEVNKQLDVFKTANNIK